MQISKIIIIDEENLLKEQLSLLPNHIEVSPTPVNEKVQQYRIITTAHPDCHQHLKNSSEIPVILISDQADEDNIAKYLYPFPLNHLIGRGPQMGEEIIKTLFKLQHSNIWGIEKYLNEDARILSTEIYHSKDAQTSINELLSQIETSDFFDTPKDYLSVIANELATNAFYHMQDSPTKDRTESIFVTPPMAVHLRVGIDKQRVAISVKDHSGTINRNLIAKSLERSFREKSPRQRTPGAGLGLYLAYQHSNQLIFNCANERETEIIGIIEASKRFLHYKQRVTSFHFFEEDNYVR